ncbi:hypothetical protein [Aliiroseovarius sp. 2305UL8-7]|uniref:hypothetical protein n=1 Tax=Aliiroseovarius conchicola TaxID=3121637 RepID=UPI0035290F23
MRRFIWAVILCGLAAWTANAEVVATTVVDGKIVHLNADRTWNFAEGAITQNGRCMPLTSGFKFCAPATEWKTTSKLSHDATLSLRHSDRDYLMVIAENIGAKVGISLDFMASVAIDNAAVALDIPKEQIPVYSVTESEVLEIPSRTMSYGLNIDGLEVVYLNTVAVTPDTSLQIITFHIGNEVGEKEKNLHQQALTYLKRTEDD